MVIGYYRHIISVPMMSESKKMSINAIAWREDIFLANFCQIYLRKNIFTQNYSFPPKTCFHANTFYAKIFLRQKYFYAKIFLRQKSFYGKNFLWAIDYGAFLLKTCLRENFCNANF